MLRLLFVEERFVKPAICSGKALSTKLHEARSVYREMSNTAGKDIGHTARKSMTVDTPFPAVARLVVLLVSRKKLI